MKSIQRTTIPDEEAIFRLDLEATLGKIPAEDEDLNRDILEDASKRYPRTLDHSPFRSSRPHHPGGAALRASEKTSNRQNSSNIPSAKIHKRRQ